jgi:hypothetical protein
MIPTLVRVPECLPTTPVGAACACKGGFCFDRADIDRITLIITSERACRVDLGECRAKTPPKPKPRGWSRGTVIGVGVGIGVGVLAVGFATGYLMGKYGPDL